MGSIFVSKSRHVQDHYISIIRDIFQLLYWLFAIFDTGLFMLILAHMERKLMVGSSILRHWNNSLIMVSLISQIKQNCQDQMFELHRILLLTPLLHYLLIWWSRSEVQTCRQINASTIIGKIFFFQIFNFLFRISRGRQTIESAFGIMAAKWRILLKPIETGVEVADLIVKATCVLHNFVINETVGARNPALNNVENIELGAFEYIPPAQMRGHNANNPSQEAKVIQQRLMQFFNGTGAVNWQNDHI